MNNEEDIKQIITELLRRLGLPFELISVTKDEHRQAFVIKSPESGMLIGARGAHISALNHLVKRIVWKKFEQKKKDENGYEMPNFYIDVNDYHDTLLQEIRNKASILAGRARSFKTTVEMEPMSSYERMIIHTFFEGVADIKTESRGEGDRRRIVLTYVGDEI